VIATVRDASLNFMVWDIDAISMIAGMVAALCAAQMSAVRPTERALRA
jgi:hypothetical protein